MFVIKTNKVRAAINKMKNILNDYQNKKRN